MKEKIKNLIVFLQKEYPNIQAFNTRNIVGDSMETVYEKDGITVDYCPHYEYIEIFGLTLKEFDYLMKNGVIS